MADHQAVHHDDHFEIVEALYQEAKLSLSEDERAAFEQADDAQKSSQDAEIATPVPQRTIIRSRKPAVTSMDTPIFTRISDLYEEAEATRILAAEEAEAEVPEEMPEEVAEAIQPDDDFSIPETFDSPLAAVTDDDHRTQEPASLSDDDITLLSDNLVQDETPPSDDVTISTQIEPAIALDDVLDGLLPPEETASQEAESQDTSSEAEALAQMDASRPQADDELAQQLAEVRSAVEHAHITPQIADDEQQETAPYSSQDTGPEKTALNASDDASDGASDDVQEAFASVATGPALASFIGETVREVLDEELPHLVRGLVDEALGERQGRYGRTETPHIGLRTKPSRH